MRGHALMLIAVTSLVLPGCIARTAANVVTAPVKVASKTVDMATTSQSEADEKRGRALRRREEEMGKLDRRYRNQMEECRDGNRAACDAASDTYAELQILMSEPVPD